MGSVRVMGQGEDGAWHEVELGQTVRQSVMFSICCRRNPDHRKRPNFYEASDSLSRPELLLTSFGEELDLTSVPPSALVLGSPLEAAKSLYLDLQHTYRKTK